MRIQGYWFMVYPNDREAEPYDQCVVAKSLESAKAALSSVIGDAVYSTIDSVGVLITFEMATWLQQNLTPVTDLEDSAPDVL